MGGHVIFVGDNDDGLPFPVDAREQCQNFRGSRGVKISSWLIGHEDLGVVENRTGDRHALLLSAGELIGTVINTVTKAHTLQRGERAFTSSAESACGGGIHQWKFHIL